jgi:4-hydroxybenzoate polyprenyltransferase
MGTSNKVTDVVGRHAVPSRPIYLLKALRPGQWIKNFLVFLPFIFAVRVAWDLNHLAPVPGIVLRLVVVFLAFCALSSAVYLLNDLMDRKADRLHPMKRYRPIASGKVGTPTVLVSILILGLGGLAALVRVDWVLSIIGLVYLFINVAYSLGVKQVVLVDVLSVSSGYIIRAAAGAVAIEVTPSPWLYATTAAAALFIVLGRRYAEVRLAGEDAAHQRSVLRYYAGPFIGQLLTISGTAALVAYTLYTVQADNLPKNHAMMLTVPFVTFGLFRYLYLLNRSEVAETPEQLISKDVPLLLSIVCWVGVAAAVLLTGS